MREPSLPVAAVTIAIATAWFATRSEPAARAQGSSCPTETYLAGSQDEFVRSDGPEAPIPDPASLAAWAGTFSQTKHFDELPQGWVFHTFHLPGVDEAPICALTVRTRVMPDTSNPLVWNDNLQFSFGEGWHEWIGAFGSGSNVAGLLPYRWGTGAGAAETVSVTLDALPLLDGTTINLIDRLNQKGFIDVIVGDDTAADFFELTVTRCCPAVPPTPDPPTQAPPTQEPPTQEPPTQEPTATATDVPSTPTSPPTTAPAACVCAPVSRQVPPAAIAHALVNPERYYGWRMPLDPGKPPGPANPIRECLNLTNPGSRYHPLYNKPIWEVGCR